MTFWIPEAAIRAIHNNLIEEHGGLIGPANDNALSSTLARPKNLNLYHQTSTTLFELAASYGFGFAKNHCFKDGNKRIALASIDIFLIMNNFELISSEQDAVISIEALASGELDEKQLALWIEQNARKYKL